MSDLGELLRQARVYKGASLRDAERATRISRTYLEALETQDFVQLPPPAYARGIVKNYAQYLGLDPAAILALYDASDDESVGESIQVVPATRPLEVRSHWAPNFAIIGFMLVVSAIVFAWLYSAYFQPQPVDPNLAAGYPTVTPIGESLLSEIILTPTVTATPEQATQAGGQEGAATTTPTQSAPTATPETVAPTATPVVVVQSETTGSDDGESNADTSSDVADGGDHEFLFTASEEVWLEVYLDWSEVPDYEGTLAAGETIALFGEVATVYSGNAGYIEVSVDGDYFGVLSTTWNATVTLP